MIGQSGKIEYNIDRFRDFFLKDKNVIFAVIFGSAKGGIINPGSDLDIGVFFKVPLEGEQFLDYYCKVCDIDKRIEVIDLVILNTANTILAFEALKGTYLCKNDIEKTAGFYSLTCREYEDVIANINYQYSLRQDYKK